MNKKPVARFIRGMTAPVSSELLPNPYHIGPVFVDELIQPTELGIYPGRQTPYDKDTSVLAALSAQVMARMLSQQVAQAVDKALQPNVPIQAEVKFDHSTNGMDIAMHIQHWAEVVRQTQVEETAVRVPPELRDRFKAEGFTDDELDRMVVYPERCNLTPPNLEIVYKLDPKTDGVS
ncbi:hypothetical protein pEaSNUABM5_00243 [Erwinia phage pEa_SNUABM_5]|uniref:Uncharacterized protein n=1 Tax=Erwinia phage pEa_SNUABM_5 TaxID=2797313 RepID=A0A7T8EPP5_9CAUD|nr:hypothetical protein MPK73_gp243 [Erwinia phage pEa_SNUABM_5]QQO90385.1 hypothetical protein pEaSNUABM5_00243 [Erwinia phage pEa_SNUABM_5]